MSNTNNSVSPEFDLSEWLGDTDSAADVQRAYDRFVPATPPPGDRPDDVRHHVPRVSDTGETVWDSYSCRVVYRGELDGLRLWQAVTTKWMHPGDKLTIGYLPPNTSILGPPTAPSEVSSDA